MMSDVESSRLSSEAALANSDGLGGGDFKRGGLLKQLALVCSPHDGMLHLRVWRRRIRV